MNQKKDLRSTKGKKQDKFQSPLPNKKRQDQNLNAFYLRELSPFRPIYGTINTAPNPAFVHTNDLAIIETPVAKSQQRHYLDQVEDNFRQISGVITWGQNIEASVSQENQNEESSFLSSQSEGESEKSAQEKIPLILQIQPFIQKQNLKQDESESELEKEIQKKQVSKIEDKPILTKRTTCNCKKTKCLKLYCDCFRENLMCNESCNCVGCHNLQSFEEERNNSMLALMDRNPLAFIPKIDVQQHSKGCHCKKSNCLKKYCQCYQAGIKCGSNCKCEDCKNDKCHEHEEIKHTRTTAKKQKKFTEIIEQN